MKKSILIACLVLGTFTLAVFGFNQRKASASDPIETQGSETQISETEEMTAIAASRAPAIYFDVDSRYLHTVTKEELNKAVSYLDIYPMDHSRTLVSCSSVEVIILDDSRQTDVRESGDSEVFNAAQLKLLQSLDYSTSILMNAQYKSAYMEDGDLVDGYGTPRMTVVPEKEARPTQGMEALITHAKDNTKEFTYLVSRDVLQDGRVFFTVTAEGAIKDASLTSTSGYPALDAKMVDLISNMPASWEPAENAKGEKVAQEFVFFFGTMGC